MTMPRVRLVVIFGGRSAEHDVSCMSARHVLAAADPAKYSIEPIGITRQGRWVLAAEAARALRSGAGAMPEALCAEGPEIKAMAVLASGAEPQVTVAWPVLHGPMGEDGTIQGLLEMAGVPYVGAGVLASALCMDKVACKQMLAAHDIGRGRYRWFTLDNHTVRTPGGATSTVQAEAERAVEDFGLPLFVKPANMGSSVGVSRATDFEALVAAVEVAAAYDRVIVIEEAITGREIEISVLGNSDPVASVAGEILPGADFYDYRDKYSDGADLLVPAPLDDEELAEARRIAVAAYRACRVEGLARVDFFYEDGSVDPAATRGWMVSEINTMPGFTPISLYPRMWAATGLDYPCLIDELVDLAIARHERTSRHARTDHQP